jgi:hypothetical protein
VSSIPDLVQSRVDSRQYRFSFAIEALSQVPAGFALPEDFVAVDAGVFLPRADPGWLGRRDYHARILLMGGGELLISPHPESGERPVRVPLESIECVEWGRILLTGWVVLTWKGGRERLPYNTRGTNAVEKCVRSIEDRWLPAASTPQTPSAAAVFGEPLNLKFENAKSAEQLPGEAPLALFFQPGLGGPRKRWRFRRSDWPAGDLVLVTSRRLLWIAERQHGRYERYGTVSHSARLPSVACVRYVRAGRSGELDVAFGSGREWHVPVREDHEPEARGFEAAVRKALCGHATI